MKKYVLQTAKLTAITLLFFAVIYPFMVWGIAQCAPNNGKGELIEANGRVYYANIGQKFTEDRYFWSRPSAVDYNAAGSGGSNKGASNLDYLKQVQARIDTFLVHNPGVAKSEIPVDLVTASGSGLDPHISVQAAKVQVKRIAQIRSIEPRVLFQLIDKNREKPLIGLFGPEAINVLKLNIDLDRITNK